MKKLQIKENIIEPVKVLSHNAGMITFLAIGQSGEKFVLTKCSWKEDLPIIQKIESFRTYFSLDLLTSSWYGHEQIGLNFSQIQALIEKQANYINESSEIFNCPKVDLIQEGDEFIQVRDFIHGDSLTIDKLRQGKLIWKVIKKLILMLKYRSHGDLKEEHIIYNSSSEEISLIDPSVMTDVFITNREYYRIAPPIFEQVNDNYMSFPDQIAIGILLYKVLTGYHPWYDSKPFWERTFGNGISDYSVDEIYSILTILPPFHVMNEERKENFTRDYVNAVHNKLFKAPSMEEELFLFVDPKFYNSGLSDAECNICMQLLGTYQPADYYLNLINNSF